jgi:hypothetical protein
MARDATGKQSVPSNRAAARRRFTASGATGPAPSSAADESGDRTSAGAAIRALHAARRDQGTFDPRLGTLGALQRARRLHVLTRHLNDQPALLALVFIRRHYPWPAVSETCGFRPFHLRMAKCIEGCCPSRRPSAIVAEWNRSGDGVPAFERRGDGIGRSRTGRRPIWPPWPASTCGKRRDRAQAALAQVGAARPAAGLRTASHPILEATGCQLLLDSAHRKSLLDTLVRKYSRSVTLRAFRNRTGVAPQLVQDFVHGVLHETLCSPLQAPRVDSSLQPQPPDPISHRPGISNSLRSSDLVQPRILSRSRATGILNSLDGRRISLHAIRKADQIG